MVDGLNIIIIRDEATMVAGAGAEAAGAGAEAAVADGDGGVEPARESGEKAKVVAIGLVGGGDEVMALDGIPLKTGVTTSTLSVSVEY